MLAPFWLKPRIGPYLRRERDKRNYFRLFRSGSAVAGLRRLTILTRARRVQIGTEWPGSVSEHVGSGAKPVLVCVHNAVKDNEKKSFAQVIAPSSPQARPLRLTKALTTRPLEPILIPKLRIYFADFPYLHYSIN